MIRICKHCKKEFEFEKPQQYGAHVTNCDKNPNQKDRRKKIKNSIKRNLYDTYKLECINCGKEYEEKLTIKQYKNGRYKKCCSKKCSYSYSSSFVDNNKTKKAKCRECGKDIDVNLRTNVNNVLCISCKMKHGKKENRTKEIVVIENKKQIICKYCGQIECKNPIICKTYYKGGYRTFNKIGFDKSKIGSLDFYEEYDRIVTLLKNEYVHKSSVEIGEKYNINHQTINGVLNRLNIKTRNISDSVKLSIKNGRYKFPNSEIYPYKSGYHINNKGNKYWYRSSYELEYCENLDKNNIDYEMENIRIEYYDTIKKCKRIAIPDFYLPKTNTIVEIKSSWTYDEQNMKNKIKKYRELGYNFKLILDKKEVEFK